MTALRFHFDFISPYAYLAWTQIHALAARHGRAVTLEPVLFAGLLDAHGQKGPAEIDAKRRYTYRDAARKASLLGVAIAPPASHPFKPLLALRAATAADSGPPRRAAVEALYVAAWARGEDVTDAGVVTRALSDAGLDGPALVAAAGQAPVKEELRRRTDEAIAEGVFGVPTVIVDGELFWGTDSLPSLERFLRGQDPLTAADRAAWAAVRPSAERRR